MRAGKFACAVAALLLVSNAQALGFDFARYQAADLDAILAQRRPQSGVDLHRGEPLKLAVTLVAHGAACETGMLKRAMIASGIPKAAIDPVPMTRCINVRSAKGAVVSLFVQDPLVPSLQSEVAVGQPVTLFVIHVFTGRDGPGLLVNEFRAENGGTPGKARQAEKKQTENQPQ